MNNACIENKPLLTFELAKRTFLCTELQSQFIDQVMLDLLILI